MIETLYDDIVQEASAVVRTRQQVERVMRSLSFTFAHLRELATLREPTDNPRFLRNDSQQRLLEEALDATGETGLVARATLTPAPLLVIAGELVARHAPSGRDLALAKALHATRVRVTSTSAPRPVLAAIVALGAVAGSLVPKETFEYLRLGWYGLYRTVIAAATVVALLYAALSFAPAYVAHRRRVLTDAVASEIIDHMLALLSRTASDSPEPYI